jgi:hypothetical protein
MDKKNKIIKFEDYLSDDITKFEPEIEELKGYVIDELVSISFEAPTTEGVIFNKGTDGDDVKKGETIYLTCMFRRKGTTSYSSPSIQGVIKCRVVDIIRGTQYLNKVLN